MSRQSTADSCFDDRRMGGLTSSAFSRSTTESFSRATTEDSVAFPVRPVNRHASGQLPGGTLNFATTLDMSPKAEVAETFGSRTPSTPTSPAASSGGESTPVGSASSWTSGTPTAAGALNVRRRNPVQFVQPDSDEDIDDFLGFEPRCTWSLPPPNINENGRNKAKRPPQTTVVFQCLPHDCSRDLLVHALQAHGFAGCFDFVYVPCNFATGKGFGYAFVNFLSEIKATNCRDFFTGFTDWEMLCEKPCVVAFAEVNGRRANVERFRNSPVMHASVSDELKPILLDKAGRRMRFPGPTKAIKAPKTSRMRVRPEDAP
jgi:RNA recognition motif-containing protein